jgi:glutaredoxin
VPFTVVEFKEGMGPLFLALGLMTVPQVWRNKQHIGGYEALKEFLEQ